MSESEIEPPEYPKMRYTRNGERYVDGKEFLKVKPDKIFWKVC